MTKTNRTTTTLIARENGGNQTIFSLILVQWGEGIGYYEIAHVGLEVDVLDHFPNTPEGLEQAKVRLSALAFGARVDADLDAGLAMLAARDTGIEDRRGVAPMSADEVAQLGEVK